MSETPLSGDTCDVPRALRAAQMVSSVAGTRADLGTTPNLSTAVLSVFDDEALNTPDAARTLARIVVDQAVALRFALAALEISTGLSFDEVVERLSARWRDLGATRD